MHRNESEILKTETLCYVADYAAFKVQEVKVSFVWQKWLDTCKYSPFEFSWIEPVDEEGLRIPKVMVFSAIRQLLRNKRRLKTMLVMCGLSRSQQSRSHCSFFYEGSTSIDDGTTNNLFAYLFSEVFVDDDDGNLDPTTPPFSPDSIPLAEVRYCCDLLMQHLTALFNRY